MKFFDLFFLFKFISVVLYFMLASQGGFYILSFYKVLLHLPAEHFIDLRKAIDQVIETPLKILYPSGLLAMLLWLFMADKSTGIAGYGFLALSLALLATDLLLAVRVSIPLNKIIQQLSADAGGQAILIQQKWLKFILIRGLISVSGFISLLLHLMAQAGKAQFTH